ncbi:hypothetical protein JMG10_11315 [Nostoc ellipsosporum NOK]|nr:hypothetical protein [Nostoc ellipsosporum NOK]
MLTVPDSYCRETNKGFSHTGAFYSKMKTTLGVTVSNSYGRETNKGFSHTGAFYSKMKTTHFGDTPSEQLWSGDQSTDIDD